MPDSPLGLLRLQFALTAGTHFLFVALTLGLVTVVAALQTRAAVTGSPVHRAMTRFWGQLYVINYGVGIVSGLLMEFQFGLDWGGLTRVAGGVFGAPLAMETVVAFFIESTFLGLWIFGWDRLNKWVHTALIWVVALTAYASALFILVANGFLQRPVGYEMRGGVARLTDFGALLSNPAAVLAFWHIFLASLLLAGLFVAAVSGYHLMRRTAEVEFFRRSMRIGLVMIIVTVFPVAEVGGSQFEYLAPTKMAGPLARQAQARFVQKFGPGDYLPPALAEAAFAVMCAIWSVLLVVAIVALVKIWSTRWLVRGRVFHGLLMVAAPLPFVAMTAGWIFREMGRQPWLIYGVLRTGDAAGHVSAASATGSFTVFVALSAVLLSVNVWLLLRHARRGPAATRLGGSVPSAAPATAFTPTY